VVKRLVRLEKSFSFVLSPKAPYNFELTVKKPAGWDLFTPFEVFEDGTMWTALHIDGTLVGLKLRSAGETESPRISVKAFLAREPDDKEETIKRLLEEKLGVNDDLSRFYGFARRDPILKHAMDDLYGMHDTLGGSVFNLVILTICLQMAPLKRSEQMMDCLVSRYGGVAEFDGRRVNAWPVPSRISVVSIKELESRCKLGYRAKYVIQLAKILDGRGFPTLEDLARLPAEESKERLMELPGIGDYSADIINPRAGFPIDSWSVDVFGKLFFGREPRDARGAIERVKNEGIRRWGRWSWMAFFYVAQDLENLSRKLNTKLRLQ
jgi:3-methyladenine DNA glycosylase/8-oxoguanine DNA glycosylase